MFTARYALSHYIKQIGFVGKGLMLYREIIAVCSEIHTKHINTLCRQNLEVLNFKQGGTHSDHRHLKG
jgi:hypothetical protein